MRFNHFQTPCIQFGRIYIFGQKRKFRKKGESFRRNLDPKEVIDTITSSLILANIKLHFLVFYLCTIKCNCMQGSILQSIISRRASEIFDFLLAASKFQLSKIRQGKNFSPNLLVFKLEEDSKISSILNGTSEGVNGIFGRFVRMMFFYSREQKYTEFIEYLHFVD